MHLHPIRLSGSLRNPEIMEKDLTQMTRSFRTTHWSMVIRAGHEDPQTRRHALEQLLRAYWNPLLFHLRAIKRLNYHKAEDILQGFVADKLIEKELFAKARAGEGKLRNLLLTALDNYAIDRHRHDAAEKRAPADMIDLDHAEEPAQPGSVPDSFDVAWARRVLEQAAELMREDCQSNGRPELWGVFEARVLTPLFSQSEPPPYAELIEKLGFASPGRAAEALVVAKTLFAKSLREVVSQYAEPQDVDSEIADLKTILAAPRNDSP